MEQERCLRLCSGLLSKLSGRHYRNQVRSLYDVPLYERRRRWHRCSSLRMCPRKWMHKTVSNNKFDVIWICILIWVYCPLSDGWDSHYYRWSYLAYAAIPRCEPATGSVFLAGYVAENTDRKCKNKKPRQLSLKPRTRWKRILNTKHNIALRKFWSSCLYFLVYTHPMCMCLNRTFNLVVEVIYSSLFIGISIDFQMIRATKWSFSFLYLNRDTLCINHTHTHIHIHTFVASTYFCLNFVLTHSFHYS